MEHTQFLSIEQLSFMRDNGFGLESTNDVWSVLGWLKTKYGKHIELIIDNWEDDECVGDELVYRIFVWTTGKPRPGPAGDLGAVSSPYQAYVYTIKYILNELMSSPDEIRKCIESPYYYATNYMTAYDADGNAHRFTTMLTEREFNEKCRFIKHPNNTRRR